MEYGINIAFFERTLSLQEAAALVSRAGFTNLDYTPPVTRDDWADNMKEAMRIFDAYGLSVHQTHIPFNRYGNYGDKHRLYMDRCLEASAFMGAKYVVAHGDEFDFEHLTFSPEAALAYNHDYFLPCVEGAKRNGYKIAFETVFEDLDRRRYTSRAEELMALILSFHSESAVCCWDFGHGHVSFRKEAPAHIRRFGKLIECVHLHDNAGHDSHQLPLTGDIDWAATMEAFKSCDYRGVMSVEYAHGRIPPSLAEDFISLTFRAAKHIGELA